MWTRTRVALALFTTLCSGLLGFLPPLRSSAEAQANVTGQWSTLPYTMPINPIHVGLLHTGKVLVVAGSENDPNKHAAESYKAAVWNLQTGTIAVQNLTWDVFCNGMAFLPDGRALIVGGTTRYDPFWGASKATIFDPVTEKFIQVESMAHGRWYATATTMSDGRILTFSGLDRLGATNSTVEVYKVAQGWSAERLAPWTPPLYPWLHLLPNGTVFSSGSNRESYVYNPSTSSWTQPPVAVTSSGLDRSNGASVLLALLPPEYKPRVMIMGGGNPGTPTAEIIDLSQPTPQWRLLPPMSRPRVYLSTVLLPNGKVLASGGSTVTAADLFDPDRVDPVSGKPGTWSSAGTAAYGRFYHSVGLLLPDATVVTAGSNPNRWTWENRIEVWKPPYLFTTDTSGNVVPAARPTIGTVCGAGGCTAPAPARIGYAGSFQVQSPNAADIGSVVLMRPGSPTHAFDMEQRLVGLNFSVAGTTLTVYPPPNANIAPPGYYMLFLLNRGGVPSIARFVHVSSTPTNTPPEGTIVAPLTDQTIIAGQTINFAGSASESASFSWLFPDGTPASSTLTNPGPVKFTTPGTFIASLTTVDALGYNDPSPPTRTITVSVNQPPTASPGGTYSGTAKLPIQFNGGGSSDPNGTSTITSYQWSFGDGTTGNGVSPTHTYASAGGYTVALTVTDNGGASSSASTTATVAANQPPTAKPGGPYSGTTQLPIQFNGGGSSDPNGTSTIASYQWTFGDGTTGNGVSPTHAYAIAGIYPVALKVTDHAGATSSASTTATVAAPAAPSLAPSNLSWTVSKSRVRLSWTDNSNNESGFRIELSTNGLNFSQVATNGADDTTYSRSIASNTSYWFRVRAYNGAGTSSYSNTVGPVRLP